MRTGEGKTGASAAARRKQAEEALRESELRYRTFFKTSRDCVFITSAEGRWLDMNDAAVELFGYSNREELMEVRIADLYVRAEDRAKHIALIAERGYTKDYACDLLKKDGSIIHTLITSVVRRDAEGRAIGFMGTIKDITERTRAEEKVKKLNEELEMRVRQRTAQLESANKELESFSYSVSHDLRAPLRAISGFAAIVARRHRDGLNEEGRHYVDNIVLASERMGKLIDDLLQYSRLGRSGVRCDRLPLGEVFDDLARDLSIRLTEAGGTLHLAEDLPVVMGDRTLLAQIFSNLLENAVTYRQKDVPAEVTVTWRPEGGNIIVCVGDNGIGIPPEYHQKIFNIFQRLHSDDEYPGTGIGLATVNKSVELLGGKVWVESASGEGSRFYVQLPAE